MICTVILEKFLVSSLFCLAWSASTATAIREDCEVIKNEKFSVANKQIF
jgi:hypothetical protein